MCFLSRFSSHDMMNYFYWSCLIPRDDTILIYATFFLIAFKLFYYLAYTFWWHKLTIAAILAIRQIFGRSVWMSNSWRLVQCYSKFRSCVHDSQRTNSLHIDSASMAQPQALSGVANGASNGERQDPGGYKLRFCTVCASNQNRFVWSKNHFCNQLTVP